MGFKKGQSGNPAGRKKGVPAKRTQIIQAFAEHIVAGGRDKYKKELSQLTGKAYIDAIHDMMEYCAPKMARTEHTGANGGPVQVAQVLIIGGKELTF